MIYPKYPEKETGASIAENIQNGQEYYVNVSMVGKVNVCKLEPKDVARYLHNNKKAATADEILLVIKAKSKQATLQQLDELLKLEKTYGSDVIAKVVDAFGATEIIKTAKQVAKETQMKEFRKGCTLKDVKKITYKSIISGLAEAEKTADAEDQTTV